jgi:hypothetical protein
VGVVSSLRTSPLQSMVLWVIENQQRRVSIMESKNDFGVETIYGSGQTFYNKIKDKFS